MTEMGSLCSACCRRLFLASLVTLPAALAAPGLALPDPRDPRVELWAAWFVGRQSIKCKSLSPLATVPGNPEIIGKKVRGKVLKCRTE